MATDDVFCDGCGRTVSEKEVVSREESWDENCELCVFCKDAPLEREAFTRGYNHGLDKLAEATVHTAKASGLRRVVLTEPEALGAEEFTPKR